MNETRVIRIFEDNQRKVDLTEQNIKDILRIKDIVGENNIILQADGKLLIRHYVGFIQINKTRLLIYPKISQNISGENEFEKSFTVLMKLLSYSGFENVKNIPNPQTIDKYKGDLLELFIGLFIDELLLQFKRDINRGYHQQLENETFIKGKVDFVETIKKNSFKKHLHYIRYDKFSEDILLNKVFKSVIQNLIKRTNSNQNKIKLKQSLLWLEDVEEIALGIDVWKNVKFNRHNFKYTTAFNMSKLFYYNSSPNLNIGDECSFSFLIPVNQLFELYLFKVINENRNRAIDVKYQSPVKYLAKSENKNFLMLKPDITITKSGQIKYILDAKYKQIFNDSKELSLSQSDIYQMIAYSIRYECDSIALIYPKLLKNEDCNLLIQELKFKNYDKEINIKLIQADLELEPSNLWEELSNVLDLDAKTL